MNIHNLYKVTNLIIIVYECEGFNIFENTE